MSARDEILQRIRSAGPVLRVDVSRDYRGAGDYAVDDALGLLKGRLEEYGACVRRCRPDEVGAAIDAALRSRGARSVVVPAGFPDHLLPADRRVTWLHDDQALTWRELDATDGVLTTCAVAIAATGTVILDAGPGQGRRALSLVPDYHLVLVRSDQVVVAVPDALPRLDPLRPLTWISGPSATSDIELNRVCGVHGPRTLEVVMID